VPRDYVEAYLQGLIDGHAGNPRVTLYLDSELGAAARQARLVAELEALEGPLRGRRCLDVGCSNGALLLAARAAGASTLVGLDVSEERLASARRLCAGTGIELLAHDVVGGLPEGCLPFDVVFCTDVLEHVSSAPRALRAIAAALAPGTSSYAYVSVFNPRHPSCVAAEPHYGVPGLVLLDPPDARAVWLSVRDGLGSALDYEVSEWPDFPSLAAAAAEAGLAVRVLDGAPPGRRFWRGYEERMEDLLATVRTGLAGLSLSAAHRDLLTARVSAYARRYLADHEAFASAPEEAAAGFHATYYAQPLRVVLRRA
jgi:SAM-dependent methyltransferase